jgi:quinolinate synthase
MTTIDPATDVFEEIEDLKQTRRAIILAHYYQDPDIQDLADHLGDSLDLARAARDASDAEVILFCGVHFMAETAKLLNPEKIVILPDLDAGCSLADACSGEALKAFREKNPDHYVVSYINCSAEAKAQSDIICTSGNAEEIIHSVPKDRPILFAPDKNLGAWLIKKTGREMTLWPGSCMVHVTFSERKILALKARHTGAKFIAHPECEPNILRHAEFIGSTRKLLQYVRESDEQTIIVGTEIGILHTMQRAAPDKELIAVPVDDSAGCEGCNQCPHMKLNTLEKIYVALRDLEPRIEMNETLRAAAAKPLLRMLAV